MKNYELQKPEDIPIEIPKIENVGETFMNWAEKNWALETLLTAGLNANAGGESCRYKFVRDIFIDKINEFSKKQALNSQPQL